MSHAPVKKPDEEFDWIQLSEDLRDKHFETFPEKFWRKVKANPFVPIGALGATSALFYGLWCFKNGDQVKSQWMMRARIGSQAFAIAALIGGIIIGNPARKKHVADAVKN